MSMALDDPKKYDQYCSLKENRWIIIGNLIRAISSSKNLVEYNFKKLLTIIIEISSDLNKRQRILVLEHFAGRTLSQEDGGIYLIQRKTNLNELLKTAINILSDFTCTVSDNTSEAGWENMQQRYKNVNKAIARAFKKFKIK